LLTGEGGEGEKGIGQGAESYDLYKSFNILWP